MGAYSKRTFSSKFWHLLLQEDRLICVDLHLLNTFRPNFKKTEHKIDSQWTVNIRQITNRIQLKLFIQIFRTISTSMLLYQWIWIFFMVFFVRLSPIKKYCNSIKQDSFSSIVYADYIISKCVQQKRIYDSSIDMSNIYIDSWWHAVARTKLVTFEFLWTD